jgi:hypothetical protein
MVALALLIDINEENTFLNWKSKDRAFYDIKGDQENKTQEIVRIKLYDSINRIVACKVYGMKL